MTIARRELAKEKLARERLAGASGGRSPPLASVVALQRMAGNRAVSQLMRSPFDEQPQGVAAGANALPAGATVADPKSAKLVADPDLGGGWTDAGGKTTSSGRVGAIDRILLEGISGSQGGKSWGEGAKARRGFAAAAGTGKAGHRGRAVALVPHSLKRKGGGPLTVVVHLHGIDINKYTGSSGMRARDGGSEDVADFQLPQQLEAFGNRHAGARVVVLMPLGATVKAGGGYTVDFGLGDMDTFVDDCLGQLGLAGAGGSVYLSAHSGGGFALSSMMADPSRLPHRYRFGGLFGFESFHGDVGTWAKFAGDRLDADLVQLEGLRAGGGAEKDITAAQLAYVRDSGFRFAAFGGSGKGYTARVGALRNAILGWFKDKQRRRRLRAATGGHTQLLNQLWRNYQAVHAEEDHMAALSQDSHFESVLESLPGVGSPGPATPGTQPASAPPPPPKPKVKAAPQAPAVQGADPGVPVGDHTDPKRHAEEEHKHEQKKPPTAAVDEEPAPESGTQPERPFAREHFAMSNKEKVLVGKAGHKRAISKPASVYTAEILKLAFPDKEPSDWYDNFTSGVRFLGRRVVHPIHIELAKHLRKVERELAATYGGPTKDPAVAGRTLGLDEGIIGARSYPTSASISMHMFGLALDVNYTHNPFIGASANDVFVRAGQLLHPGKAKTVWTSGMSYAQLSELNTMLTEYFKLANDSTALEKKLGAATGPWVGMNTKDAQARIEADLSQAPVKADKRRNIKADRGGLAWRWARGNDVEVIRETGFMNVKEDLVRGLKMNWGAAYGDNMHFDLRTDGGVGEKVFGAIGRYMKKLKEQADAPDATPAP